MTSLLAPLFRGWVGWKRGDVRVSALDPEPGLPLRVAVLFTFACSCWVSARFHSRITTRSLLEHPTSTLSSPLSLCVHRQPPRVHGCRQHITHPGSKSGETARLGLVAKPPPAPSSPPGDRCSFDILLSFLAKSTDLHSRHRRRSLIDSLSPLLCPTAPPLLARSTSSPSAQTCCEACRSRSVSRSSLVFGRILICRQPTMSPISRGHGAAMRQSRRAASVFVHQEERFETDRQDFCTPAEMKFDYPNNTGIAYSL